MQQIVDIVGWVKDKPRFWQSAIEKLIKFNNISEDDFLDIVEICKAEHDLSSIEIKETNLDNLLNIASNTESQNRVILSKISDVSNINALSAASTIEFQSQGITAIYGDNGAGKSSLTSILKHVCNTRGKKPKISTNLYDNDSNKKDQAAKIFYTYDNETFKEVEFRNNTIDDTTLRCINVFDTSSANAYIDSEDEIAFVPNGISILEKFASFLKRVELHLREEKEALGRGKFDLSFLQVRENSKSKKFLSGISKETTITELRQTSMHSKESESEIDKVKVAIEDLKKLDPAAVIKVHNEKIGRYQILQSKFSKIEKQLYGKEEIQKLDDLFKDLIANQEAVKIVESEDIFSNLPLPEVGGTLWKKLWESARDFYNSSVKGAAFPPVENESICPLCQQGLDDAAKSRFISFEGYVKQDVQQKYKDVRSKVDKAIKEIEGIDLNFDELAPTINELNEADEKYTQVQKDYLQELSDKKDYLIDRFSKLEKGDLVSSDITSSAIDLIDSQIKILEKKNQELAAKSIGDELAILNDKHNDLLEAKLLWSFKPKLAREIFRLKKEHKLDKCISKCNTRTVTTLSNTLSDTYITNGLQESLKSELAKLGFDYINIKTETKGSAGKQYHYLRLNEENVGSIKLKDILSEGEHRCIALAAFLSELSLSHQPSAIVFDDPVSSLDHKWRNRIAKRLVQESQIRQIIIFTHDITFLHMIEQHHEHIGGDLKVISLTRKRTETGISRANPPWDALSLKLRLGILKQAHQDLAKIGRQGTEEEYNEAAKILYGKLREAWERFIEEVYLNGVIQRFGREIQTKRLEKIVDLTSDDYNAVDHHMSKCSTYFSGHDTAEELNEVVPNSDEILEDITALEKFAAEIRKRRN